MSATRKKSSSLTIRLTEEKRAKLEALRSAIPYAPSITAIIERGIDLAAKELEVIATKIGGADGTP